MRALWLVALLFIPATAQAETETAATAIEGCFDSYEGEGGSLPSARLTGDPQYVYVPGSIEPSREDAADDSRGWGTYITWGSGCVDDTFVAASEPAFGL